MEKVVLWIGLALTTLNIIDRIFLIKDRASAPHKEHEQRLNCLEEEVRGIKAKLSNNNERIENLEKGGRVLLKSMGALLNHGIDGNNIEEMRVCREEVNDYLIGR